MIPTPNQLFDRFERGEIDRDELQAMMAVHARELIAEMEEDRMNPAAAWLETLRARRMASKWIGQHGVGLLREVLHALSLVPGFPPARILWNASHPDLPLHVFFRIKREPVFRITSLVRKDGKVELVCEYGSAGKGRATRREFSLRRDASWRLQVLDDV